MYRSILVPLDGTTFAEHALPVAMSLARRANARLHLVSVSPPLTEAYLEGGEAEKARVIAEDLLLRNPRSVTHKDRLRRILTSLGEKDPDAVIAERLPTS